MSMALRWKAVSPTASTSSTSSTSGSLKAATPNPSRAYIPDEYHLTGRVHELLDAGELDDLVQAACGLREADAQDRALEEDVLAAGQLGVEAGPKLDQRDHLAGHQHPSSWSARSLARAA